LTTKTLLNNTNNILDVKIFYKNPSNFTYNFDYTRINLRKFLKKKRNTQSGSAFSREATNDARDATGPPVCRERLCSRSLVLHATRSLSHRASV